MIVEYHRPTSVDEALRLLARKEPHTVPLAGGTTLNRRKPGIDERPLAVVDLQGLGLDRIERLGNVLSVGAMVTLQALYDQGDLPAAVRQAIQQEANFNLRQAASLAGTLVAATGRSSLTTLLLAMDTKIVWAPGDQEASLGEWLPLRGQPRPGGQSESLMVRVQIPLAASVSFASVSRTPLDWPIVCAGMAKWPSGRTRLAIGGSGFAPVMAMDGSDSSGVEEAAKGAYSQAGDEWASAEYRREMAGMLARRCLSQIEGQ